MPIDAQGAFSHTFPVTADMIDRQNHVNNVVYVQWMQDVAIAHSRACGGYAAMEQALRRRYTRLIKGEGEMPDLLIIDGGLGQVRRALGVLKELQVDSVTTLGIAKGVERISGSERYFLGENEIVINGRSEAAHLLQHIRDEAHRFAISGHRARRGKKRNQSELEEIVGVGPKRRRQLLMHFGSPAGIRGASAEELAKVPGISGTIAHQIYNALHE